jgi:hypothetical protein
MSLKHTAWKEHGVFYSLIDLCDRFFYSVKIFQLFKLPGTSLYSGVEYHLFIPRNYT